MISLIQDFEADFLWKVSLKILNSGIILKISPMHMSQLTKTIRASHEILVYTSFLANSDFCHLLITVANNLDQNQDRQKKARPGGH